MSHLRYRRLEEPQRGGITNSMEYLHAESLPKDAARSWELFIKGEAMHLLPVFFDGESLLFWPYERRRHSVEDIADVLFEFAQKPRGKLTDRQRGAAQRLVDILDADAALPEDADQTLSMTEAEVWAIYWELDTLFFGGTLGTNVYVQAVDEGEMDCLGDTYLFPAPAPGENKICRIRAKLMNEASNHCPRRVHRRSQFIAVMVHEMVHAAFLIFGCICSDCSKVHDAKWGSQGAKGHGFGWNKVASAMNIMFLAIFGNSYQVTRLEEESVLYESRLTDPLGIVVSFRCEFEIVPLTFGVFDPNTGEKREWYLPRNQQ